MKSATILPLLLAALTATVHGAPADEERAPSLKFVPLQGSDITDQGGRLLKKNGRSPWGFMVDDYTGKLCVTNIDGKVKMDKCKLGNVEQQWRFDSTISGDSWYQYTGFLQTRVDKRCVRVKGSIARGQKLEISDCDPDRFDRKQLWLADGDIFGPRSDETLCAQHRSQPPKRLDPVILEKCKNSYSMDFGDLDDENVDDGY